MFKELILSKLNNKIIHNSEIFADCPFCRKPGSRKKFSFSPDKGNKSKSGIYHCFSCGNAGTGWQLAGHLGLTLSCGYKQKLQSYSPPAKSEKQHKPINRFSDFNTKIKIENGKPVVPDLMLYETCDPETGNILFFKIVQKYAGKKQLFSGHYKDGAPVYGLPENIIKYPFNLHKAKEAEIIYIPEGEKAATVLNLFLPSGHRAIGTHGHSGMSGLPIEAIKYLRNKKVFILPDNDSVGRKAAATLSSRLTGYKIENKIIELPSTKKGYDIADFLQDYSINKFFSIIEKTGGSHTDNFINKYLPDVCTSTEKFNTRYVNQTLTPALIMARQEKFVIIKAPPGTGKTETFSELAEMAKALGMDTIALTHRIALGSQIADRLDVRFYLSEEADILSENGKLPRGSIVCSIDSAPRIALPVRPYILLIDEIDQLLDHLLRSTTMRGNRREAAISSLKGLFENAEKVIVSSADIPGWIIALFTELGHDCIVFENEYKVTNKTFTIIETPANLFTEINRALDASDNIAVGFSSINRLKKEARKLEKERPLINILQIHSGNSQTEKIQNIIKEPQLLLNYDAIFYSPSIFTGADFNNVPQFTKVFLFINGTDTPATEVLQAASRFRMTKEIFIYIKNNRGHREVDAEKIKSNLLDFKLNKEYNYTQIDPKTLNREFKPELAPFINAYCSIEAEDNLSINHLRNNCYNLLKQKGYSITIDDSEDSRTPEQIEADKLRQAEIREEFCEEIKQAPVIDKETAATLDQGRAETPVQEAALHRFKLTEINGGNSEIEKIVDEFHDKKPEIIDAKIENFERMLSENYLKNQRDQQIENHNISYVPDRRRWHARAELCRKIDGQLAKLFDEKEAENWKNNISCIFKNKKEELEKIQVLDKKLFYEEIFSPSEINKIESRKNKYFENFHDYIISIEIKNEKEFNENEKDKIKLERIIFYEKQKGNLKKRTKQNLKKAEKLKKKIIDQMTASVDRGNNTLAEGYSGVLITSDSRKSIYEFITENADRITTLLKINCKSILEAPEDEREAEIGYFIRSFYGLYGLKTKRLGRAAERYICRKRLKIIRKIVENRKNEASVSHDFVNNKEKYDVQLAPNLLLIE